MFTKLILFVLVQSSTAVILKLNASDYARMPPIFHLDNYEECFIDREAIYCAAHISLVSDEPSELLTIIREFSAYHFNYNHTLLRHGYCMNKTCKKFLNVSGGDLRLSLEACLNESLYDQYKLKAIVLNNTDCFKRDREQPIDNLDISVGVICLVILLANLIGSFCDRYLEKGRDLAGLRFLYCFSIFRNWKKFVATSGDGLDPRVEALKGINGIRAVTMYFIISSHSMVINFVNIVNPEEIENVHDSKFFHLFANGSLIIQTFLVISNFIMVYIWLIESEKIAISWNILPKKILLRWLRLTPTYALVLGLTVTWFGRLASGPFWKVRSYDEISDCRRDWWKHFLYINNYSDERSACMTHTWYLATDTQLYCLGVVIFLMCRTGLTRKVVLSLLFVVGTIIPTLHIYYQHLHGAMVGYPEMEMNLMINPTFHKLYIKGHANLTGCIIGMALGYIIYSWQKAGGNFNNLRKYRYIYWSLFFWYVLCNYSGSVYYRRVEPVPLYLELLIGALVKPFYGITIALIIAGLAIQFEGLYRPILEWQPFIYLGRLTYTAYLLHFVIIKTDAFSMTNLSRCSTIGIILKGVSIVVSTFIAAFFFSLLVESPSRNLIYEVFRRPTTQSKDDNKASVEEFEKVEDDITIESGHTTIEDGAIVVKMGTTK